MSAQNNTPRRPSINYWCVFFAGFICVAVYVITMIISLDMDSANFTFKRPAIASYHSLFLRKTGLSDEKSNRHLQPLKEMFTNLTEKKRHSKLNKSDCMSMAPADFSDLEEFEQKESVLLLVIVSTAPSRQDRRAAIRETWWRKCQGKIACKFLTDGLQISKEQKQQLLKEKQFYRDIEFQPIAGGRTFGLRYLYHIMWASAKYNFLYLLRIDDDYFVCIERLLHELHQRPVKMLKWGWYHCAFRNLIYADEAWTLFSHDVIERFLSQDAHRMLCHPHADQQIPIWIKSVYNESEALIHFDDRRLYHYPPAKEINEFTSATRVCDTFMGVHGSSPDLMRRFWHNSNDTAKEIAPLTDLSQTCDKPNVFNISLMGKPYKFDLRPCIDNPQWTPGETMWLGIHSGAQKITYP